MNELIKELNAYLDKEDERVLEMQIRPADDMSYKRGLRAGASRVIEEVGRIVNKYSIEVTE